MLVTNVLYTGKHVDLNVLPNDNYAFTFYTTFDTQLMFNLRVVEYQLRRHSTNVHKG